MPEYEGAVEPLIPLPSGWVCFHDDDGEEYYFCPETGETLWEHPSLSPPSTASTTTSGGSGTVRSRGSTDDDSSFFSRLLGRRGSSEALKEPSPTMPAGSNPDTGPAHVGEESSVDTVADGNSPPVPSAAASSESLKSSGGQVRWVARDAGNPPPPSGAPPQATSSSFFSSSTKAGNAAAAAERPVPSGWTRHSAVEAVAGSVESEPSAESGAEGGDRNTQFYYRHLGAGLVTWEHPSELSYTTRGRLWLLEREQAKAKADSEARAKAFSAFSDVAQGGDSTTAAQGSSSGNSGSGGAAEAAQGGGEEESEAKLEAELLARRDALVEASKSRATALAAMATEVERRAAKIKELEASLSSEADAEVTHRELREKRAKSLKELTTKLKEYEPGLHDDEEEDGAEGSKQEEEKSVDVTSSLLAMAGLSGVQTGAEAEAIVAAATAAVRREKASAALRIQGKSFAEAVAAGRRQSRERAHELAKEVASLVHGKNKNPLLAPSLSLSLASEPFASSVLGSVAVAEELLEWEAWSPLFAWSSRLDYLPAPLRALPAPERVTTATSAAAAAAVTSDGAKKRAGSGSKKTEEEEHPPVFTDVYGSRRVSCCCVVAASGGGGGGGGGGSGVLAAAVASGEVGGGESAPEVLTLAGDPVPLPSASSSSSSSSSFSPSGNDAGDGVPAAATPAAVTWAWVGEWQVASSTAELKSPASFLLPPGGPLLRHQLEKEPWVEALDGATDQDGWRFGGTLSELLPPPPPTPAAAPDGEDDSSQGGGGRRSRSGSCSSNGGSGSSGGGSGGFGGFVVSGADAKADMLARLGRGSGGGGGGGAGSGGSGERGGASGGGSSSGGSSGDGSSGGGGSAFPGDAGGGTPHLRIRRRRWRRVRVVDSVNGLSGSSLQLLSLATTITRLEHERFLLSERFVAAQASLHASLAAEHAFATSSTAGGGGASSLSTSSSSSSMSSGGGGVERRGSGGGGGGARKDGAGSGGGGGMGAPSSSPAAASEQKLTELRMATEKVSEDLELGKALLAEAEARLDALHREHEEAQAADEFNRFRKAHEALQEKLALAASLEELVEGAESPSISVRNSVEDSGPAATAAADAAASSALALEEEGEAAAAASGSSSSALEGDNESAEVAASSSSSAAAVSAAALREALEKEADKVEEEKKSRSQAPAPGPAATPAVSSAEYDDL